MSSSLEQLDTCSASFRPALSVLFTHMDAVIVILCSFGICLSSLPNLSFSKVSADTKDAQPFLQGSMKSVDHFNGSIDELAQSLRTVSMCGAFFYAKWDSDSMEARDTVELLHSFSPIKLFAVDCWFPTAPCRTKMNLKRFPQLKLYAQNAGSFSVDDLRSVSHVADRLAFLMKPLVFVHSEEDLYRLTLSHKFIVLGYFKFGRSDSKEFLRYHQASLSVCNLLPQNFICGRELIFAVAPNTLRLSVGGTGLVQFYFRCNSSTVTYDYREQHLEAEVLMDKIVQQIRKIPTHCLFSTDITPNTNGRSTQMDTVFSNGPVLLLIGPHTSTAKGMDPPLYLLRSLELSYKNCPPKNDSSVHPTLFNSDWKEVSFTRHHEPFVIMHQMALSAYDKRCQQASVCPRWLRYLSPLLGLESKHVCGVPAHGSTLLHSDDTLEAQGTEQPILSKILGMLNNSHRSGLLTLVINLIHELSLDRDSSVPVHHPGIDATALVERLHFICCHWYHRHRHAEYDILSSPGCAFDVAPLTEPPTLPASSSVVNGLACGLNKTLSFHTLDSLKHSQLVWSLTGFDADLLSSNFGAAIVDKTAEAVYRLEEPVSYESLSRFVADYHGSKLSAWRRHPLPSGENRYQSSNISHILEIRNASHLEHLLDTRSHLRTGTTYLPTTFQIRSGLLLLYYTRACGYALHGDSLLWHFTRVAESFFNEQTVVFAKVDVSQVDLPWHLRVERVPTVIFFPANRSTYSTRFHWPTILPVDPSFELINFVRTQLGNQLLARHTSSVQLSSVRARTRLWQSLQETGNKLNSDSLVTLRNSCSYRQSPSKSVACLKEILTSLQGYIDKYVQAIKVASSVVAHLEETLKGINIRLSCPLTRLYWSIHSPQQFNRSLHMLVKQSNMWTNALEHKSNLSNILLHLVSHAEAIKLLL